VYEGFVFPRGLVALCGVLLAGLCPAGAQGRVQDRLQEHVEQVAPVTRRWGAVMPRYANIALARQKSMIPGVDMVRNRLVETYSVLTATHGEEMVRSMP